MVGCFGLFSCLRTCCNSTHSWDNRFVITVFSVHPKKNSKERVTKTAKYGLSCTGAGGGRGGATSHTFSFFPLRLESRNDRRRVEISSSVFLQT